jgi:hypothetical protein
VHLLANANVPIDDGTIFLSHPIFINGYSQHAGLPGARRPTINS